VGLLARTAAALGKFGKFPLRKFARANNEAGGFAALRSFDAKYLYYAKGRDLPGIWRVPVNGGEETKLLDGAPVGGWGYYAVTSDGIYYPDVAASAKTRFTFIPSRPKQVL